jgi:hypothetical protein
LEEEKCSQKNREPEKVHDAVGLSRFLPPPTGIERYQSLAGVLQAGLFEARGAKIHHCAPSFRDYPSLCGLAADCFFDGRGCNCRGAVVGPISPAQIQLRA